MRFSSKGVSRESGREFQLKQASPSKQKPHPYTDALGCRINQHAFNCLGKVYLNNLNATDFGFGWKVVPTILRYQRCSRISLAREGEKRKKRKLRERGYVDDYPISFGLREPTLLLVQQQLAANSRQELCSTRFCLTTQPSQNVKFTIHVHVYPHMYT